MDTVVLTIDDNENNQKLIIAGLSDQYKVNVAMSSTEGIKMAEEIKPDIILLDVSMPDQDGYAVCEMLRESVETENIPVIFVSGKTAVEDRLRGYKSGGDDYVCKPIDISELKSKIAIHLTRVKEFKSLREQLHNASSTAMLAMTTNGETGAVLNFIIDTYQCSCYEELAQKTNAYLDQTGLQACLQIRGVEKNQEFTTNKHISPIEQELLSSAANANRIISVGNKTIFNDKHTTLLCKNMPVEDDMLVGRLRDNLAIIVKGVNARVEILRLEEASRLERNEKLTAAIAILRDHMHDMNDYFETFHHRIHSIKEELVDDTEHRLMTMGLSKSQETELLDTLRESNEKLQELYEQSTGLDSRFVSLEASLLEATLM